MIVMIVMPFGPANIFRIEKFEREENITIITIITKPPSCAKRVAPNPSGIGFSGLRGSEAAIFKGSAVKLCGAGCGAEMAESGSKTAPAVARMTFVAALGGDRRGEHHVMRGGLAALCLLYGQSRQPRGIGAVSLF
jgi:hypothetical protein